MNSFELLLLISEQFKPWELFLYGERYVGKRTVREVLRPDTLMTAVGEVVMAKDVQGTIVRPPTSEGKDFFLVAMTLEEFRVDLTKEGRALKVS